MFLLDIFILGTPSNVNCMIHSSFHSYHRSQINEGTINQSCINHYFSFLILMSVRPNNRLDQRSWTNGLRATPASLTQIKQISPDLSPFTNKWSIKQIWHFARDQLSAKNKKPFLLFPQLLFCAKRYFKTCNFSPAGTRLFEWGNIMFSKTVHSAYDYISYFEIINEVWQAPCDKCFLMLKKRIF